MLLLEPCRQKPFGTSRRQQTGYQRIAADRLEPQLKENGNRSKNQSSQYTSQDWQAVLKARGLEWGTSDRKNAAAKNLLQPRSERDSQRGLPLGYAAQAEIEKRGGGEQFRLSDLSGTAQIQAYKNRLAPKILPQVGHATTPAAPVQLAKSQYTLRRKRRSTPASRCCVRIFYYELSALQPL